MFITQFTFIVSIQCKKSWNIIFYFWKSRNRLVLSPYSHISQISITLFFYRILGICIVYLYIWSEMMILLHKTLCVLKKINIYPCIKHITITSVTSVLCRYVLHVSYVYKLFFFLTFLVLWILRLCSYTKCIIVIYMLLYFVLLNVVISVCL